jgi:membrane fusion protein, heavy metal efflux system
MITTYIKTLLAGASLAFVPSISFAAVSADEAANTVILTETAVKNLGIETAEAEETEFEQTVFSIGRIRVAPGSRAIVSSRIPGRALAVEAHIDTKVEKGAELVVLESRQPGDPPPSIRLFSPISGHISKVNVAPGQPVGVEDSLIEIIDLSAVHAVAELPEHLAGRVKPGQTARIRVAGFPDKEFDAEVKHIGVEAEASAGTIEVAFHLENPDALLRPGMRAEFSIAVEKREGVLSIPRSALQGDALNRGVYRKHYDASLENTFVRIPVTVGAMNERFVEVTTGLTAGDEVVTKGGYSLAYAGKGNVSLKEALDAAHGHPHNEDGSEMTPEQQAAEKSGGGAVHEHSHAHGFSKLTTFFAATSGLLFILLVVMGIALRRRNAA